MLLIAMAALAMAQTSELGAAPRTLDAEFRPLKKSERGHARNGPAGPYYPQAAYDGRVSGLGLLRCRVGAGGELQGCKPVAETPKNSNFAIAARIMADRKRIFVAGDTAPGETINVRVPFVLGAPAAVEP